MAKDTGFMQFEREEPPKRAVVERIRDYQEFEGMLPEDRLLRQAARCMDCGIPFCHSVGCPVYNRIPDWTDLIYRGDWRRALDLLHATDNFPEFTGRVCPAPCEAACTLAINAAAVSIRQIELQIVERGWREGWIRAAPAGYSSGKRIAVVGSGPAGLAAAQQLARRGHQVIVFEKADRIGGTLRYGIPDFKLAKSVIDRRLQQMRAEGVVFETQVDVGIDISVHYLDRTFDAVILANGAAQPRDLELPGRDLKGIHFAMEFLTQQNRRLMGDDIPPEEEILAGGKRVVVIGGGDTGSDCVGTCRRQGAAHITQIELLPKPPEQRDVRNPWPLWPNILRTSSSQEEGCERLWGIQTTSFSGHGNVNSVHGIKLEWKGEKCQPVPGSGFTLQADLVLLATGYLHIEHGPLIEHLGVKLTARGDIAVDEHAMTSVPAVFAAGDSVLGASLVVRAIQQGREAAAGVERYLRG